MSVVMFGIPNCDTIKKAKKWLTQQNIDFCFHDYRKQGVPQDTLQEAMDSLGWEVLVNKRGTTFRQLSEEQKQALSKETVLSVLAEFPAVIKRPLLSVNGQYHVGFKADLYAEIFQ